MKMTFGAYYQALAANLQKDFPEYFSRGMLLAELGYVDPEGLGAVVESRRAVEALTLVPVESWFRSHR